MTINKAGEVSVKITDLDMTSQCFPLPVLYRLIDRSRDGGPTYRFLPKPNDSINFVCLSSLSI